MLGSLQRFVPMIRAGAHAWPAVVLLAASLVGGCRTGRNYLSPGGPRYAGGGIVAAPAAGRIDTLRVVSFNIKFALHVDSAIAVLTEDPALRQADVLLLQEMDARATRRIAMSLGLQWVYYPASHRFGTGRDFGNAILSRWPILSDAKIILPHNGWLGGSQRIATAATLRVGRSLVRVYSAHLGTMGEVGVAARRDQLRTILVDAARYPRVVVGGDMNNASVGEVARGMGYEWPTAQGPRTVLLGRWDHIFVRGLEVSGGRSAGTVLDNHAASDHRPVWAVLLLDPRAQGLSGAGRQIP